MVRPALSGPGDCNGVDDIFGVIRALLARFSVFLAAAASAVFDGVADALWTRLFTLGCGESVDFGSGGFSVGK
jgi:hypothetical protein